MYEDRYQPHPHYNQNQYHQYYAPQQYQQQQYGMQYQQYQYYPQQNYQQQRPKKHQERSTINENDYHGPIPRIEDLRPIYPSLQNVNLPLEVKAGAHFVIIRSASIDNVHKGMKHGVWTSTSRSNQKLNNLFKQAQQSKQDVYLLYTVVNSQAFQGVAKLMGPFDPKNTFLYWDEPHKWFGTFPVQWVFINEVSQQLLEEQSKVFDIPNQSWTEQGDCTQISFDQGNFIVKCFNLINDRPENKIVAKFPYLDRKEDEITNQRDGNQEFLNQHFANQAIFEQSPFEYRQSKQRRYNNRGNFYQNQYQEYNHYPQYQQNRQNQQFYHQQQYHQQMPQYQQPNHYHQNQYPPQQPQYTQQNFYYSYKEDQQESKLEERFPVHQAKQKTSQPQDRKFKKLRRNPNQMDYIPDPNAIVPNVEENYDEPEQDQ